MDSPEMLTFDYDITILFHKLSHKNDDFWQILPKQPIVVFHSCGSSAKNNIIITLKLKLNKVYVQNIHERVINIQAL